MELVGLPLAPATCCTMLPRLSTRNESEVPPCVTEPSKPSTSAHHRCQRTRHVVQSGDQQGVEVEGGEDAVDDVDEVAEADDQLELGLHIDDSEVDFLDRERHAGVDGDEAGDVGVEVDVRSQVFHVQINTAHGEIRHVKQNVRGELRWMLRRWERTKFERWERWERERRKG